MRFMTKRIYELPRPSDGTRVLIDRLWPRGLSKADAAIDQWAKDLAPSHELRRWFAHEPERFDTFIENYHAELAENAETVATWLKAWKADRHETITLVYATRDDRPHHAPVLRIYLQKQSEAG
ncbi:MAG: DUF488 family protein [Planctomycetota bacterium]